MLSNSSDLGARFSTREAVDARIRQTHVLGTAVLRYGVVFLLVTIGMAKFFAFEAEGIKPLVANSPLLSWMLGVFGVRGTADVIGSIEIVAGVAMATRRFAPVLSALGSAIGVLIFLTTLSFLFSTPGALSLKHPASAFLMKDIVLLGACIATGSEALREAHVRRRV
ncbi:MAG TPA: DUF417 family protein [Kofleriaceae bacterium]|nr:DUF417 family protein [Kofleriaceae bacterium]